MDIEGHLRGMEEAGRAEDLAAERLRTRIDESIPVLRNAFGEFTDALVRYKVPQRKLVQLAYETVPAVRGWLKSTPSQRRMTAVVLGSCWPFHKTLLFSDGGILDASGAGRGDYVVPFGNKWGDRDYFLKLALPALTEAGLRSEFSYRCVYIVKNETGLEQLRNLDWSNLRGSEIRGGDMAGGIELWVHGDEYVVKGNQVFIRVDDGTYEGRKIEVLLEKACAGYIAAERI